MNTHCLKPRIILFLDNIARNKDTKQSSDYGKDYKSGNAVNGNLNDFTHTKDEINQWWMVDLGSIYDVTHIQLYNRRDLGGEYLCVLQLCVCTYTVVQVYTYTMLQLCLCTHTNLQLCVCTYTIAYTYTMLQLCLCTHTNLQLCVCTYTIVYTYTML